MFRRMCGRERKRLASIGGGAETAPLAKQRNNDGKKRKKAEKRGEICQYIPSAIGFFVDSSQKRRMRFGASESEIKNNILKSGEVYANIYHEISIEDCTVRKMAGNTDFRAFRARIPRTEERTSGCCFVLFSRGRTGMRE